MKRNGANVAAALVVAVSAVSGCSAAARGPAMVRVRPACPDSAVFDGKQCVDRTAATAEIERGAAALAEFRVDEALQILERVRALAPHRHEDNVRLYEQLGIAYAYLEREQEAVAAFDVLLTLDPGHLLSYTLSPKATFLFERARAAAQRRAAPAIDLSWDRDLEVARPTVVELETVADPTSSLRRASLHMRVRGQTDYRVVDVELPPVGEYRRVVLPAVEAETDQILELYVTASDRAGNEVVRWADSQRPRDIPLTYDPPVPWYRTWWVWAIAAGVAATATGVGVAIATDDPSSELDVDVAVR